MDILSVFLISLGLSMDNLAVALAAGCSRRGELPCRVVWQVGILFAFAHFMMFSIGFGGGYELIKWMGKIGTWIASAILMYIGIHMIYQSRSSSAVSDKGVLASFKIQIILALATSMDALLVGLGLGLTRAPFWLTVGVLSLCVFITSIGGFYAGHRLGRRFGQAVECIGGAILVLLGVKWLL